MKAKILSVKNLINKFFKINEYQIEIDSFDGKKIKQTRLLFERGHAAACLLYDSNINKVLFIEQFRIGAIHTENPWQLEIIAGMIDLTDKSSCDTIVREIKEESGISIKPEQLKLIFSGFPSVGGCSETIDIYVADIDLSSIIDNSLYGLDEESEDIRVRLFSIEETFLMKDNFMINQATSMIALQWLENYLKTN